MSKIELTHIDKYYGKNHVLKDLNLTIEDGDFMTLLGPSGCGKTTTLRVVSGLEKPQNGIILMDGKEIVNAAEASFAPPSKRNLNLVFQSYALWPHMTVFDNVAFGLRIRKENSETIAKKVASALDRMQIGEFAKRYPTELSGGQQQRVAIARAIVSEPILRLLDEPLSNLDAKLRVDMRAELKRLHHETGTTIIYVTHDQEEALTLSDRIAVFNKGVIEQIGTPNEVYNHSATEFGCNFIGDINRRETPLVQHLNDRGAGLDPAKHNYIRLERLHVNVEPRDGELALSGVVESQHGYHVILRMPTQGDDLVMSSNGSQQTLRMLVAQEQLGSLLTGWVDEADISWEPKFSSIDYAAVFTPKESFWKRLDVFDWFEK